MITGCQLEYWIIMQKMNAAQQEYQLKDIHCESRSSVFDAKTLSRRIYLKVEAFHLISQFDYSDRKTDIRSILNVKIFGLEMHKSNQLIALYCKEMRSVNAQTRIARHFL